MSLRLTLGIAPEHRTEAARLYWQAFSDKLGRVLGPEPMALAYLNRVIRADHAIGAVGQGRLLGLAGFKSPEGGFADGKWSDLRATFGMAGGAWRIALLAALGNEVDNRRFLVDGICVAEDARGHGIGSALVEGLCDLARQRGYGEVRLEVVDTNTRARALYARHGFEGTEVMRLGLLRHAFGFESAETMIRRL